MRIMGINCLNHDAAISVIEDGEIIFAGHSERYSRKKNDEYLNDEIVSEALSHGKPDKIVYYERPYLKKSRQMFAGQYKEALSTKNIPGQYLKKWFDTSKISYVDHHRSHAAAGYYTSKYEKAAILVIDGIGEWDVISVWKGDKGILKKVYSISYPNSLGLLYTAFTHRLNLKPCEEEYILMGMSAWGKDKIVKRIQKDFLKNNKTFGLKRNLHKGIGEYATEIDDFDIAASIQRVTEICLDKILLKVKDLLPDIENLVYMGGVALNCVANSKVIFNHYENVWIMPNPGDAGSSLGCAAAVYGKKLNWKSCFLGTNITNEYPVNEAMKALLDNKIVGVASGKAEFGPRALGNRSLLADPRGKEIKDKVNEIKKRQKFRPFAPAILEEKASQYFEMPTNRVPYMQYIAKCKYPDLFPAICHVDNTSRIQTVSKKDNPGFYNLLKQFEKKTGCPILLNTSLNIKGQPIVNDIVDAIEFEKFYGVKVCY